MKNALASLTLTLLCAASAAAAKPDWVDGQSAKYPRAMYLVGVGMADDRDAARDRARGEIARIFSSLVSVNTEVAETETNVNQASNFSQKVSQTVQTASKKVLEGVEVVEEWQDEKTKVRYALAVLDRDKGEGALVDRINEFDKQAEEWKAAMDKASDKLPKVKAGMKLLAVLKAREELNSELRVLDREGKGLPSKIDAGAAKTAAAKAVADLDVALDISGGSADQVETGVVTGLTKLGFSALPNTTAGDIVISGKVETKPIEVAGKDWKWARSTLTLNLKDGRSGKVFLKIDSAERGSSGADYNEAARRSLVKLGEKVSPQIHDAVASYFENQ